MSSKKYIFFSIIRGDLLFLRSGTILLAMKTVNLEQGIDFVIFIVAITDSCIVIITINGTNRITIY